MWIQNARKARVVVTDSAKYSTAYRAWWDKLNPSWRTRRDGQLVIEGSGDWATMAVPGTNGFVNVIAGLVALRKTVELQVWTDYVRDVQWVVHEVLQFQQASKCVTFL